EAAVADLAALRAAHAAALAHRIRREVVVEQEGVLRLAFRRVDDLRIATGTEGDRHDGLRFATSEQRRTVGARQHADANADRTDVFETAAVDALFGLEHTVAHGAVFEILEFSGDVGGRPALFF